MAIHKASQRHNYTILDNRILRGTELSATAKMVLAICLSLPDDWKFNIRGLSTFCAEGPDAVARAIKELEKAGYIKRRRIRVKGKITGIEYEIYEVPRLHEQPYAEAPDVGTPEQVNPDMATPGQEPETLTITNLPIIDIPNIYDTYDLSINQIDAIEDKLRKQIEYDVMCQRYDSRLLDDIVSVMVSVMVAKGEMMSVGKDMAYPTAYVQSCMDRINPLHIEQIMESMLQNQPTIHNVRAYLLAALINTANTMDMGYQFG